MSTPLLRNDDHRSTPFIISILPTELSVYRPYSFCRPVHGLYLGKEVVMGSTLICTSTVNGFTQIQGFSWVLQIIQTLMTSLDDFPVNVETSASSIRGLLVNLYILVR